ncbi:hypothetical protein IGB42_04051 [Andreprevotia sp. IGB-42]|uniref:hypothetical protein n=1 Tax=Andreprevotia sp. IGB-42 TaxID=2497473 RepID=UPI0013579AC1|nr:hypothetical protein [Andreprevotia sp. IGB-42]KAF0811433.1 hypothetical protein IGB42_04051 [Andreprevotia sp. IGB-42]
MELRKIIGPGLAVLVGIGLVGGLVFSAFNKQQHDRIQADADSVVTVRGLVGSEKEAFYRDTRVVAAFKRLGLAVVVEKAGSREIVARPDLKSFDFGHPAGAPAALKLQQAVKANRVFTPFYTPMAVASWRALVPVLEANGLVKQRAGAYYIIDLTRLLQMIASGTRWRELKDNSVYDTGRAVLISSTDVRKSNSAAMYLALASYLLNDSNVVQSDEEIRKVLPIASGLFLKQGFQEASSAGPFEDYVSMGIGKAPLVMVYEAQFLEYQSKLPQLNADMVLLYPQPTVFTKHVLVPLTPKGVRVGEALVNDHELQRLAAEYGYRGADTAHFQSFLMQKKLFAPASLVDVIDPPSYETLEKMIEAIAVKFQ